jgi:hypothetical protein
VWANLTVGWLGIGTAQSVAWFLAATAGLNAAALLFLLRSVVGPRYAALAYVLSVTIGASVFVFGHQLNLATFFSIPIALGLLLRAPAFTRRGRVIASAALVAVGFLSPMWWIVVLVLMLPFMTVAPLLRARWKSLLDLLLVWGALMVGLAMQGVAFAVAASGGPGGDTTREPWMSNLFPGSTTSLMVGSPFVRELFPGLTERLQPGAGLVTAIGLPMVLMAACSFVVVIGVAPRRSPSGVDTLVLNSATAVAVLYWLGGGLGNFQAALAVIVGTTSPARVWYRMAVVMAVVGAAWVLLLLRDARERDTPRSTLLTGWASFGLAGVLVVGAVGDLAAHDSTFVYTDADTPQPWLPAVSFISESLAPCPVAQFPNEGIPVGRLAVVPADPDLYLGLVPYVIEPDFFWSAGVYDPEDPSGLAAMPVVLGETDLDRLQAAGYCAVLFDKTTSRKAVEQNVEIEGRELGAALTPDFDDERYSVFLLD